MDEKFLSGKINRALAFDRKREKDQNEEA